jgi:hypothetical protein
VLYRTFHNVKLNANHQIYTLLYQLERLYTKNDDKLPSVVYVQIDGGSENVNKTVLAMLSLLVAKRVGGVRQIVLTRLPVGHTHEDIDSIFGVLSRWIFKNYIKDPQGYETAIKQALSRKGITSEVIDVFVVPDFEAFISPYIDENFARYSQHICLLYLYFFRYLLVVPLVATHLFMLICLVLASFSLSATHCTSMVEYVFILLTQVCKRSIHDSPVHLHCSRSIFRAPCWSGSDLPQVCFR